MHSLQTAGPRLTAKHVPFRPCGRTLWGVEMGKERRKIYFTFYGLIKRKSFLPLAVEKTSINIQTEAGNWADTSNCTSQGNPICISVIGFLNFNGGFQTGLMIQWGAVKLYTVCLRLSVSWCTLWLQLCSRYSTKDAKSRQTFNRTGFEYEGATGSFRDKLKWDFCQVLLPLKIS